MRTSGAILVPPNATLLARSLALAAVIVAPARADWEYLPPLYACSPTLAGCTAPAHECVANPNHPQATNDAACRACGADQKYWPCDVDGLCYCWDTSRPRIPPAPSTRRADGGRGLNVSATDPCALLTPGVFAALAPDAAPPYHYAGFCAAVRKYNADHPDEGVFNMGSEGQQRAELAAFFGNALHESDEFRAGREYLMCADRVEMGGEVYCRPCDASSFNWDAMACPAHASLASEGRAFNAYCQSNLLPPEGCECDDVYERANSGPLAGFVKANQVYFGRGSIQLSWNYNYIRASVALTGAPQTFCQRPDLVATNGEYAWGAGLFYWMENVKSELTCHQSVLLNGEFGETLDNINGGLECPADDHGWHGKAIVLRLNRYCRAATALGLEDLLSLEGCLGMEDRMGQCLREGTCRDCKAWEGKLKFLKGGADGGGQEEGNGDDCRKKNKKKCKGAQRNNADPSSKGDKEEDKKDKNKKDKDKKDRDKKDKDTNAEDADKTELVTEREDTTVTEETPQPTIQPTTRPMARPTTRPTTQPPTSLPTTPLPTSFPPNQGPQQSPSCNGLPCQVPAHVQASFEFCRSSAGVCGAGPQYCNVRATWTAACPPAAAPTITGLTAREEAAALTTTSAAAGRPTVARRTRRPTGFPVSAAPTTPVTSLGPTGTEASASAVTQVFISVPPPNQEARTPNLSEGPKKSVATTSRPVPRPTRTPTSEEASATTQVFINLPPRPPSEERRSDDAASPTNHFVTHSKGRNESPSSFGGGAVRPARENAAATPPESRGPENGGTESLGEQFGISSGMTNWANTRLEYPPSVSPGATPYPPPVSAPATTPDTLPEGPRGGLPTRLPTKKHSIDSDDSDDKMLVEHSMVIEETPAEGELVEPKPGTHALSSDPSSAATAAPSESSARSQEQQKERISYYTQLNRNYFLFSPTDDVTISRSRPSTNFGAEPTLLIDMLNGDAVLLRFDLSVLGDGTIKQATLRLTAQDDEDEESGRGGIVYYIQPTINGWTESRVTYATAPKANGALFASVASVAKNRDSATGRRSVELNITEAAANHHVSDEAISFRLTSTDRLRKELFYSKEHLSQGKEDDVPVLLVTLESVTDLSKSTVVPTTTTISTILPFQLGSGGKIMAESVTDGSKKLVPVPTPSVGSISGHVWLDRNKNGIKDAVEPGLRGILVELYSCDDNDTWIDGTRTAPGGDFTFDEAVLAGSRVRVVVSTASDEYGFSTAAAGAMGVVSDVDSKGHGNCVTATATEVSVNAGIVQLPQITAGASTVPGSAPAAESSEVNEKESSDTFNYNCRGKPCPEMGSDGEVYCRSKFQFCGVGEEYCNSDSQWTVDCGTPNPIHQPSASPTTGKPTGAPTTSHPTLTHDPNIHCSGNPCNEGDGTWCRSEIGYCGSGVLYCNVYSSWIPICDQANIGGNSVPTESPSFSSLLEITDSPSLQEIQAPSKEDAMFSSFALPTLSHILNPKQIDVGTPMRGRGNGVQHNAPLSAITELPATKTSNGDTTLANNEAMEINNGAEETPWYVRFADINPADRNAGFRLSLGSIILYSATAIFLLC